MKGQRNRLTEDDIYQCGRCGEMWWQWEGLGPGGPRSHVEVCTNRAAAEYRQLELL